MPVGLAMGRTSQEGMGDERAGAHRVAAQQQGIAGEWRVFVQGCDCFRACGMYCLYRLEDPGQPATVRELIMPSRVWSTEGKGLKLFPAVGQCKLASRSIRNVAADVLGNEECLFGDRACRVRQRVISCVAPAGIELRQTPFGFEADDGRSALNKWAFLDPNWSEDCN